MRQFQLVQFIVVAAQQFLHYLQQHSGSVFMEKSRRGEGNFIPEGAQGDKTITCFPGLEGAEQARNGISNAQTSCSSHFLYSMRMHVFAQQ